MPSWNQRRQLKKRESPPSSSSTVITAESFQDSDNEDDFAPLISTQEHPDNKLEAVEEEGRKTLQGRRRSLMRNASGSLSKRWGRNTTSGNDGSGERPMPPMRSTSFSLRGISRAPSFTLPRTRFSLSRRTLSSRDMMGCGVNKPQGSPTKKKRSYLIKRCDLPEVKERKDNVESSLQKYLDIDEEDEEDHITLPRRSMKTEGTIEAKPTRKNKDAKKKKKKTKKTKEQSSPSTASTPSKSVFGSWADKSRGEKSWSNLSRGNVNDTDVSSKQNQKRKKNRKTTRGSSKTKDASSKKQASRPILAPPSPQTTRRPPRSPHSMRRRLAPPSPRIHSSTQTRAAQLNFDEMNSKSGLRHLPAIESPLTA